MPDQEQPLRHERAQAIFDEMPEIAEDMDTAPEPDETTRAFLDRLGASGTPEEAITFAAQALSTRYAVWWGHECLRFVSDRLGPSDQEMLGLAAAWVAEPDEENRRAALEAAMVSTERSPGVWLAMAAGWSGGSMAPPDLEAVPPPSHLAGRGVNAGILAALARVPRDSRQEVLSGFVEMAKALLDG